MRGVRAIRRTATLRFDAPLERVLPLFTPAGERVWAGGWDPSFPAGEHGDGADPGTVFTTEHSGPTTWIVVDRTEARAQYARVVHGRNAGLVTVTCAPDQHGGGTAVEVSYALTALTSEGDAELAHFEDQYDAMMRHWQDAVAAALTSGAGLA